MSDGIMLVLGEDGVAREYDDTWDITIHCESEKEQKAVWEKLNNLNREVKNSTDTIYRQDAIDALMDEFKRTPTMAIRAKYVIEQLPSTKLIAIASPDAIQDKPKFYPERWSEIL